MPRCQLTAVRSNELVVFSSDESHLRDNVLVSRQYFYCLSLVLVLGPSDCLVLRLALTVVFPSLVSAAASVAAVTNPSVLYPPLGLSFSSCLPSRRQKFWFWGQGSLSQFTFNFFSFHFPFLSCFLSRLFIAACPFSYTFMHM